MASLSHDLSGIFISSNIIVTVFFSFTFRPLTYDGKAVIPNGTEEEQFVTTFPPGSLYMYSPGIEVTRLRHHPTQYSSTVVQSVSHSEIICGKMDNSATQMTVCLSALAICKKSVFPKPNLQQL